MRRIRAVALAAAAALACTPADSPIVVGVSLSTNDMIAARLAAREINESGGIDGRPLLLRAVDDWDGAEVMPDVAVAHAAALSTDEDVVAVIGPPDSSSALVMAPIFSRERIPNIVTIASHAAVTRIGDTTYRLCISDEQQGRALARYVAMTLAARQVAVFFVNDDYGRGLSHTFSREFESLGGRISAAVPHRNRLGEDDLSSIGLTLDRLSRNSPPDAFVLFQRIDAAYDTLRMIGEAGFERPVVGGDALGNAVMLRPRFELVEGLLASQLAAPRGETESARAARDSIRVSTGFDPSYGQLIAYDAVQLLAAALRSEGHRRADILRYLEALAREHTVVDGIAGRFSFGDDRSARRDLYLARVRNARFEPIGVQAFGHDAARTSTGD